MGKAIIDFISEYVPISGNSTIDSILFAIISFVSLSIAFSLVGDLFDFLGFYDADIMSGAHWFIRVFVFCALTYLGVESAKFIRWLFSFQWWVYVIAGIVAVALIILIYYIKYRICEFIARQMPAHEELEAETTTLREEAEPKSIEVGSRYHCPRCRSKLVKRNGPYGEFYGCDSYGKTGCRYTRRFL